MSTQKFQAHDWADAHRRRLTTRNTHEDALSDREFEQLLEACREVKPGRRLETRFICLMAGRLGLRGGEITHFRTDWIDWDRKVIRIPKHEPCDCGYCRYQAKQETEHNESLTQEMALQGRWHPKTSNSSRVVPFDISLRVEMCLERFEERFDGYPSSRSTVNRRIRDAATKAGLTGHVYPHCLRATAASYHSYRGVPPVPLQGLMGWSDLSTAQKYIRISGSATAKAVRQVHRQ